MKIIESTTPKQGGVYFGKIKGAKNWQCLIELGGTAPFLKIKKIHTLLGNERLFGDMDLGNLDWSEPIEVIEDNKVTSDFEELDVVSGFVIPSNLKLQIYKLLTAGNKLQAIKLLKDTANENGFFLGLKEAKEYCDNQGFNITFFK